MEFREVRSLATLGKLESIAKTAQQMNLTPAAVHKQIKNLENEFGVRLYEKTGRSVHLTQAAHAIMPYLDDLVAQHEAIFSVLREWKGLKRGFLRIGANPAMSSFLTPRVLQRFRQKWPDVTPILDVNTSSALLDGIANRSLDLALGIWTDADLAGVTIRARWEYELVLVAANRTDVPARAKIADLSRFPFVRLPEGTHLSNTIEAYLEGHGLEPSEALVVNNAHTIISMVRAGLGIAMLPIWAVASDLKAGALHVIRQQEPALLFHLDLITPRSRYLSPAAQAFIELARNHKWQHMRLHD